MSSVLFKFGQRSLPVLRTTLLRRSSPSETFCSKRGLTTKSPLNHGLSGRKPPSSSSRPYSTEATQRDEKSLANRLGLISVAIFVAVGAGVLGYYDYVQQKRKAEESRIKSVGKTLLGGPFELVDHTGATVTDESYRGRWLLMYFGFTFCPDICPDELEKMAEAINMLDQKRSVGPVVQPVFISIDPARDTVSKVASYVQEFHPRMIGLTGSEEQVAKAAAAYRVYFSRAEGQGEDYLIDHSIIMYLVDPSGKFVDYFGKNYTAQQLADAIAERVRSYDIEHDSAPVHLRKKIASLLPERIASLLLP